MAYRTLDGSSWVAAFGHDVNNPGTKEYPFKTGSGSKNFVSQTLVNKNLGSFNYADGHVRIINDGTKLLDKVKTTHNFTFIRCDNNESIGPFKNCQFVLCKNLGASIGGVKLSASFCLFLNCHFKNRPVGNLTNCTWLYTNFPNNSQEVVRPVFRNSIVVVNTITNLNWTANQYNNCFVSQVVDVNGVVVDFTNANTSEDRVNRIRQELVDQYGGNLDDYLPNCFHFLDVEECGFNNVDADDYSLSPDSPLATASNNQSFIGAFDVAQRFNANVDGVDAGNLPDSNFIGDFIASSAVNIGFNQNEASPSDHFFTLSNGSNGFGKINSKPKQIHRIRTFSKLNFFGNEEPRNRVVASAQEQWEDTDISLVFNSSSGKYEYTNIEEFRVYEILGGNGTYNTNTFNGGDFLIGVNGVTTLESDSPISIRRSLFYTNEEPTRNTILIRTSKGAQIITPGTNVLQANFWYCVLEDSIIYDGKTFLKDSIFLTNSELSFSAPGNGKVQEVFQDDEIANPFLPFELNSDLTVNTDDNTATGSITNTNGDKSFDYSQELKLFIKYFQVQLNINPNSAPANL